jgi:hypothetical protein
VIAKINDPVRAAAYAELGVVTLCRTNLMVDSVAKHYLNLPMQTGPGIDIPETPGHEHPHPRPMPARATRRSPSSPARTAGQGRADFGRSSRRSVSSPNEADAARAQKLGFRAAERG